MNKPHNPHCVCETCHQLRAYMAPVDEAKPEQEQNHAVSMAQIGHALIQGGASQMFAAPGSDDNLGARLADAVKNIESSVIRGFGGVKVELAADGRRYADGGFIHEPENLSGKIDGAKVKLRYSQNRATDAIHNLMVDFEHQRLLSHGHLSPGDEHRLVMARAMLAMISMMGPES